MNNVNLNTATMEELQTELVRLAGVVVEAENQRQDILAVMKQRKSEVKSRERVRGMNALDRETLSAVLAEDRRK